jgi:ribonuclease HI
MRRGGFQTIEERCVKRMVDWKERTLSQVAKEVLIKSVVQALPTYVMSVFKLPLGLCDSLEKQSRAFWWLPRQCLIRSKRYGGLGLKDMRCFNQALLAHQAMRLLTYPDSLCARVLKAKYFHHGNLHDMAPAAEASITWRAIEYGVELLRHVAIYRIGDGESVRIWRDKWIPRPPSLRPTGSRRTCRLRRVSQLIRQGTNDWDENRVRQFFYAWDANEILKIKLPASKIPDTIAWHYDNLGGFSVRSAYRLALSRSQDLEAEGSSSSPKGESAVWKSLWSLPIPRKVQNFLGKMVNNGLPTNENRRYRHRHLTADGKCELCSSVKEDCFHAVMKCPHAHALRSAMRRVWRLPPEERLRDVGPEWFLVLLDSWRKEEVALLAMVLWRVWSVRNKITRAGEGLSIDDSVAFLQRMMVQWQAAQEAKTEGGRDSSIRQPCSQVKYWTPPASDSIKVNVDGAFNPMSGAAAVGVIARDNAGNPYIMAWRLLFNCRDAEEAEALAVLEGIRFAERWPANTSIVVESDCSNLVGREIDRSVLSGVISDIQTAMSRFNSCLLQKVGREQNKAAHNLAQMALKTISSKASFSFVPPCIQDLVFDDRLRCRNPGHVT